jgi:Na+-transporting methylmalonyl-CoA/oxaloacetate decarboxylase gamma subunit
MQGAELALLGMGTVFAFLAALVLLTMLMSLMLKVLDNEPAAAMDSNIDPTTLAVISAAIAKYKSRQRS